MRSHFAGDVHSRAPRTAHRFDRAGSGNMGDVQVCARHLREDHVAGHHRLLRSRRNSAHAQKRGVKPLVHHPAVAQIRIFFVRDHRNAQHRRVFQRPSHELRVPDRFSVVADPDASGGTKIGNLRQLFPFQSSAHRPDGIHATRAVPRRLGNDHLGHGALVVRRNRVGHRANCRVAAGDGGARSGGDRLLVLLPRFAEMRMQIDEAGNDHQSGGIDDFAGRAQLFPGVGDHAVFDEQIDFRVEIP